MFNVIKFRSCCLDGIYRRLFLMCSLTIYAVFAQTKPLSFWDIHLRVARENNGNALAVVGIQREFYHNFHKLYWIGCEGSYRENSKEPSVLFGGGARQIHARGKVTGLYVLGKMSYLGNVHPYWRLGSYIGLERLTHFAWTNYGFVVPLYKDYFTFFYHINFLKLLPRVVPKSGLNLAVLSLKNNHYNLSINLGADLIFWRGIIPEVVFQYSFRTQKWSWRVGLQYENYPYTAMLSTRYRYRSV